MTARIVISGMGAVTAAGATVDALGAAVRAGQSALSPIIDLRVSHFRARFAGQCGDLPLDPSLPPTADRHVILALAAARQALAAAGILPIPAGLRVAVVHATCSGPMLTIEKQYGRALGGAAGLDAAEIFARRYDSGALMLARAFGATGPVLTITTACSASTCAAGAALWLIRSGLADAALVGGADAFSLTTLAGFDALRATCESRCAPFSKPTGMCLGEGAAYAVIETRESAKYRRAGVLAEILGFGSSNDAYHCSSPDPSGGGSALAMRRALADAAIGPEAIGYVNAHGTGTESNDKAETKAVRAAFDAAAERIPMSSIKAVTGHCLGAAGMIEIVATVASADAGVVPPTAGFAGPREGCALDYVPDTGRPWPAGLAFMSNNLAFGGNNASIVVAPRGESAPLGRPAAAQRVVISGCAAIPPQAVSPDEAAMWGLAGRVDGASELDIGAVDRRLDVRNFDRASVLATAAAAQALAAAGLGARRAERTDVGLFMHCAHAPVWAESEHIAGVLGSGFHTDRLTAFPFVVPNAMSGNVARALGLRGANVTTCQGAGSAVSGLALAACALGHGVDGALVSVAADERPLGLLSGALSGPGATEGACAFVLERADRLAGRGGRPLGSVAGYALSMDPTAGADSLAATAKQALAEAGIGPHMVDMVCAGLGSPREAQALERLGGGIESRIAFPRLTDDLPASCGAALTLGMVLRAARVEGAGRTNYILTLLGSPDGYNVAVVIQALLPVPRVEA